MKPIPCLFVYLRMQMDALDGELKQVRLRHKGHRGEPGEQGEKGEPGPKGDDGEPGRNGLPGEMVCSVSSTVE